MKSVSAMPQSAIMTKDLRLRMRGWRWAGVATLYVAILGGAAITFLLQKYSPTSGTSGPADSGIRLLQGLSILQLFLIAFVTPATVAGAISGERQHRTWDFVVVSQAPLRAVVWGKFLAGIAFNLILVAASVPIFSLALLFGGLTPGDFVAPFCVFIATVVLFGALSLLISAATARLTVSYMASMLVAMLLTVGVALLVLYLEAPGGSGVLTLGGIAFGTFIQPTALSPFAQIAPLVALLSTLPSESGGTLLGNLGTIHHAFGFHTQLRLWVVYVLFTAIISIASMFATSRLARSTTGVKLLRRSSRNRRAVGAADRAS